MNAGELQLSRRMLGLNKADMALLLRTPYRTYQDWELGNRPIPGVCAVAVELLVERDRSIMEKVKKDVMEKFSHGLPERAQKL